LYATFIGIRSTNAADDTGVWVSFKSAPVDEDSLLLSGYLYKPDEQGSFPAVIVLHDCAGIDWHHKNWAKQLTKWGYVALIVDSLNARTVRNNCDYVWQVSPKDRVSDIFGAAYFLQQQQYVNGKHIGIIGFSNGGVAGLKAIQKEVLPLPKMDSFPIKAAVLFYPWCNSELDQNIKVPTLIHIGKDDDWTQSYRCVELQNRLSKPDLVELIVYEGAHHGFDRPKKYRKYLGHTLEYNSFATQQALKKTKEFFDMYLTMN
jgi:dienelactone hydrolase